MNFGINWEEEHRRTLLERNALLEHSSESIARSQAVAAETEQIGAEVLSELEGQREQLLRGNRRLSQTDEELHEIRKILHVMRRKTLIQRCIYILIILIEVVILGIVIYFKFFYK
ncbi:Vesicle transport through interaction with t-SNAREs like protein 1B [Habropoda laboriosa]|uniref:Vesicle transport through interaction with t-SNAREs like protein 1B n=1 Tax=Habropoda laboriosa TaxID=597456 RepID=A0A0L7RG74_9HYME|nr:PREDICTED: vesicle transport through interaction with t-SNAREs homolog 1B-like [Habropoda laboriosa]KOC69829.1 Vesicle transport through interaction with t-SNAREs like protein 1B [Habropoda laboriosa]